MSSTCSGSRPLSFGLRGPCGSTPYFFRIRAAVTMAKVFREIGYDTAIIGKWHVNGRGRASYIPPEFRQGFGVLGPRAFFVGAGPTFFQQPQPTNSIPVAIYNADERHWFETDLSEP